LLLKHGANSNLQRLNFIGVARNGREIDVGRFYKGTSSQNRYTLFETIASYYRYRGPDNAPRLPFPDFTRVQINRIVLKENKTKDINVDVDTILKSGECSHDVWLEWGDLVDIPEQDHPINERWAGLSSEIGDALRIQRCVVTGEFRRTGHAQHATVVQLIEQASRGVRGATPVIHFGA